MTSTIKLLQEDCEVLLQRALLNQELVAFGEDGQGLHGRADEAGRFRCEAVFVHLESDDADDPTVMTGVAQLFLEGYDSAHAGHICTDLNFMISLNWHMKSVGIDPCLTYSALSEQGETYVQMDIDVGKLLAG